VGSWWRQPWNDTGHASGRRDISHDNGLLVLVKCDQFIGTFIGDLARVWHAWFREREHLKEQIELGV